MLAQHLITKPVFDALFEGYDFAAHNPVSLVMQDMLDVLDEQGIETETETPGEFYASVRQPRRRDRQRRGQAADHHRAVREVLQERLPQDRRIPRHRLHAGRDRRLHPPLRRRRAPRPSSARHSPTRACTFSTRSPAPARSSSGCSSPASSADDLLRKYATELHANEIMLLAYYIAAVNIEATFHGTRRRRYVPFDGIVLTDTFQMHEDGDTADREIFPDNNDRVERQLATPITVIVGNPPYSVGQARPTTTTRT